jgi:hypothetical protein
MGVIKSAKMKPSVHLEPSGTNYNVVCDECGDVVLAGVSETSAYMAGSQIALEHYRHKHPTKSAERTGDNGRSHE